MRSCTFALLCGVLGVLAGAAQDRPPAEVVRREVLLADSQFADLESGTALSRPRVGPLAADLQFLSCPFNKLRFRPINGARICGLVARSLLETPADLSSSRFLDAPFEVGTGSGDVISAAFALKLRSGKYARVFVSLRDEEPAVAVLTYLLQENGKPVFPAPVEDLRASYRGDGRVQVAWRDPRRQHFVVRWSSGELKGQQVVRKTSSVIAGLPTGQCVRISVRAVLPAGLGTPACTTVWTAPMGVVRGRISGKRPDGGYSVNFRAAKLDPSDPDWVPYFWRMGVPPGGGLLRLGEGERLFQHTRELPTDGYTRFHRRFDKGDVFAIRLRDGRYVMVFIRPEKEDLRDQVSFDYLFLAGGGHRIPAGPGKLTARVSERQIELRWRSHPDAKRFRVQRRVRGLWERLATTTSTSYTLQDPVRNEQYALAVAIVDRHEADQGISEITVSTFPSWWKQGRVVLAWDCENGLQIPSNAIRQDSGDFHVSSSAGGMSSLTLTGEALCNRQVPDLAGKGTLTILRELRALTYTKSIDTDSDRPKTEHFVVKLARRGYAIVQIGEECTRPRSGRVFSYIYIPLLDARRIVEICRASGAPAPQDLARKLPPLLRGLRSNDWQQRDRAEQEMRRWPTSTIPLLGSLLQREDTSLDTRTRLERIILGIFHRE